NLYTEALTYDELGNILTLNRKNGAATLNNFTYNYANASVRGNKLWGITDTGTEGLTTNYTYDANGSIQSDSHKAVNSIVYNELNLPSLVNITTGSKTIAYNYDATGKKLERIVKLAGVVQEDRVYDDGIEYTTSTIEFVHTPEGRALPSLGGYIFEYQVIDHLGNIRSTFGDKNNDGILSSSEIVQASDYYAFGREIIYSQNLIPSPDNKYKYNNKEYEFDLAEYDYGARFYDAVIGRWNTIDPLAEKARRWTPYRYGFDNPIRYIDPDGMNEASDYWDEVGKGFDPNGVYGPASSSGGNGGAKKTSNFYVSVVASENENQDLTVTQTTTTVTHTPTSTGEIIETIIQTITDIVSVSNEVATKPGDVTTSTSTTTIVNGKRTTKDGPTTTEARNKADVSVLSKIDQHLEAFKISHHQQFNKVNSDHWSDALGISAGGGLSAFEIPLGLAIKGLDGIGQFLSLFSGTGSLDVMKDGVIGVTKDVTDNKPITLFMSKNGGVPGYDHFQIKKTIVYP
ncbi:MAG: repeat-associated core domain protein, partial [Mucilaginibacter sp.]|nr:repeat-associated core domain protein [Mucilaginibacter sp.]